MSTVVDRSGYRLNVGIILVNKQGYVFWGRRIGQDTWQFPQGGVALHESAEEALFRELFEEVGLQAEDVKIIGCTKHWLRYRLPKQFLRLNQKTPLVIGQKQKWFLLELVSNEQKIRLDLSSSPEFDSWRWVNYWYPANKVIHFKQQVYKQALKELQGHMKKLGTEL